MNPSDFPRRILLAVTGLSPQIVTETVYALSRENVPFLPTEIHLITTVEGAEQAKRSLLSEQKGWFHRLCRDYGLPAIRFDASNNIHILRAADGNPLEDIRSHEDNLLAADFITEKVREFSADNDAALHVSIAGGRKTMGFFLGYALSLFGRPQDRLSHVLVSTPFESSGDFFYPTPNESIITRDKKLYDARDARVILADIPFVSLRHGLPADLLNGHAHYIDVVQQARQHLGPPSLEIRLRERTIRAGSGKPFRLPPSQLAFFTLFARRARHGDEALAAPAKGSGDETLAQAYLRELALISPDSDHGGTRHALRNGMDGDFFSQMLSKLRRQIKKHLHAAAARPYLIDDGDCRPHRYRLALDPARITIIPS